MPSRYSGGADQDEAVPAVSHHLGREQLQYSAPRVGAGRRAVRRRARPEERVPDPGVADQLVLDARGLQRGADLLALPGVDQRVVLADQVEDPAGDPRGLRQRGRGLAQRDVGGGQPAAVQDGGPNRGSSGRPWRRPRRPAPGRARAGAGSRTPPGVRRRRVPASGRARRPCGRTRARWPGTRPRPGRRPPRGYPGSPRTARAPRSPPWRPGSPRAGPGRRAGWFRRRRGSS